MYFLFTRYGVTTQEAYKYVASIRFCSNPNEGFVAQLKEYEPIYRAMHVVPRQLPEAPAQNRCGKRSLDSDDDDDDRAAGPNKGGKF